MGYQRKQRGMTMVEMMMTVLIAAILATIAVPSFKTLLQNNRAQADSGLLARSLNYARSEAIRRSSDIRVTALSNSTDWSQGWRVWVDTDKDGSYDSGEELQHQNALSSGAALTGSVSDVVFQSSGFSNDGTLVFSTVRSFLYVRGTSSYCTTVGHAGRIAQEKKSSCP